MFTGGHSGGFVVAQLDGPNNVPMLIQRLLDAVAHAQLQTPIGLEAVFECLGLLHQKRVATSLVDQAMETLIFIVIRVGVVRNRFPLARLKGLTYASQRVCRGAARRQPCAHGLQFRHDFKHVHQGRDPDFGHKSAPLGQHLDQTADFQLLQSLAHRCARHLKARHQSLDLHLLARSHPPIDDVVFQLVAHPLNTGATGGQGFHARTIDRNSANERIVRLGNRWGLILGGPINCCI